MEPARLAFAGRKRHFGDDEAAAEDAVAAARMGWGRRRATIALWIRIRIGRATVINRFGDRSTVDTVIAAPVIVTVWLVKHATTRCHPRRHGGMRHQVPRHDGDDDEEPDDAQNNCHALFLPPCRTRFQYGESGRDVTRRRNTIRRGPPMIADGYTDVAPGKIASVVTFLDMRALPAPRPEPVRTDLGLIRLGVLDGARYRSIFGRIGERWMWFSRLGLDDAALAALLGGADIEAYIVRADGRDAGLLELDVGAPDETEMVYLGLVDEAIGQGIGRWLMNRAIEKAYARPIRRFWLHTCHLDHPGAIAFYMRSGFRPYKQAIEIADDPRLKGLLPREAVPQAPLFE